MRLGLGLSAAVAAVMLAASAVAGPPSMAHVTLAQDEPASGRLLVFAQPLADAMDRNGKLDDSVDANPFRGPGSSEVAATEVARIAAGAPVEMDLDETVYPQPFSALPPGDYAVQAVLDRNHDYNYAGRGAGDIVSPVVRVRLPLSAPLELALSDVLPLIDPWAPKGVEPDLLKRLAAARPHAAPIDFVSPALTAFWGRRIDMRGWVLTPPGYDPHAAATYPTLYYTQGFGGSAERSVGVLARVYDAMRRGAMPPMIWVFLDESSPTGTHEFADSVNNGPWGQALTTELIPHLEQAYRMDARPSGRFLNGHSSGGWATLWLQTRYPKLFGGTWSTSPDPSDFHDFTNVDLYAPGANAYRRPDGSPTPLVRDKGEVKATFQQFARLEDVIGLYGGQLRSFEWVFSPRGPDGRPAEMFDRATGRVHPEVVAYWRDHYDIAWRISRDWPTLKPDLDGKIHLAVGTADTFYLDGSARRLKAVLDQLGAKADFRFIPGRTHGDLYKVGDNPQGLLEAFTWEMYALARPGASRPAQGPVAQAGSATAER